MDMTPDPTAAGFDATRLTRVADHLQTRYIAPGKIAGAQVAVVRGGTLAYFESFGHQDRERQVPVAPDAIWRLYSMTKPITGAAMMTLYEQGHFQLDDPVERWIPEWRNMTARETGPDRHDPSRPSPATAHDPRHLEPHVRHWIRLREQ